MTALEQMRAYVERNVFWPWRPWTCDALIDARLLEDLTTLAALAPAEDRERILAGDRRQRNPG